MQRNKNWKSKALSSFWSVFDQIYSWLKEKKFQAAARNGQLNFRKIHLNLKKLWLTLTVSCLFFFHYSLNSLNFSLHLSRSFSFFYQEKKIIRNFFLSINPKNKPFFLFSGNKGISIRHLITSLAQPSSIF